MSWFLLALLTALFHSLAAVYSKKSLEKLHEYPVTALLAILTVIFIAPAALWQGLPAVTSPFWPALLTGGTLNVLALIFFMRALKISDLSLCYPLITLTPIFLLVTSPILVGEFPTLLGVAGVVLIFFGSYALNLREKSKGVLAPLKALLESKGARLMLGVALIWSVTANIDKIGVLNSSPLLWIVAIHLFIGLACLALTWWRCPEEFQKIRKNAAPLLILGGFKSAGIACQMMAIELALVAYVISIKRTSVIFAVLWGVLFFSEEGWQERLGGAVLMAAGVALIGLS